MRKIIALAAGALLLSGCAGGGTPQSCLDALDAAEDVMGVSSQMVTVFNEVIEGPVIDAIMGAFSQDSDAMALAAEELEAYTERIEMFGAQVHESNYPELAQQCRNGK